MKLDRRILCRVVEQAEHEPISILIFKWCLIVVALGMLGFVLFLMGEVLYAWFSGQLKQEYNWAMGNYTEALLLKRKNLSLDDEDELTPSTLRAPSATQN